MQVEDLLQQCTVKLSTPGQLGWGTGFFVGPGLILTCAHVIKALVTPNRVRVRWQQQVDFAEAELVHQVPDLDLALLQFTPRDADLPCVYLDEEVQTGQELYFFGYPDEDFEHGCPVTGSCEGFTGDVPPLIKFKLAQVRPGMSGSALLNRQTGKVCGMVKFTRNKSFDLGGGAIPTHVILEQFPELRELQRGFHQGDCRWVNLTTAQPEKVVPDNGIPSSTPAEGSSIRSDRLLFEKLLKQFSYDSNMVYFLRDCDVGDSFPVRWLEEIDSFAQEWNDALHEFIDPNLEKKRADLIQKLISFKDGLWSNTWRTGSNGDFLSMELDEFNHEHPRWNKRDELNALGTEIYNAHQELIRVCKTVLGSPEAS